MVRCRAGESRSGPAGSRRRACGRGGCLPAGVRAVEVEAEVEIHVRVVRGRLRLGRGRTGRASEEIQERRIDVHRVDRRPAVGTRAHRLRGLEDRDGAVAGTGGLFDSLIRRVII
ncbi:hypothetical protein DMB66_51440 [Actinoplanes sp. ATCC 53533]|nr:hypothetical protein DMB66_51440 [Actinoplanes sp. ATCC 53533]